jgi:hypothetical protein
VRVRGWWAALPLLLTACASEQDIRIQEQVTAARGRNAWAGAALALLVTLAVRHVVFATAEERAARRALRGRPAKRFEVYSRPPGVWLVVSAVMTEVLCDAALLGGGAIVGWVVGPVPYADATFEGILLFFIVVVMVPVAAAMASLALLVQGVAARLPRVGTPTLVFLGLPHAGIVALGVSGLVNGEGDGRWGALIPVVLGLVGAGGFWSEVVQRRRRPTYG